MSSTLKKEIGRRRTFAIISHPDAGKTTLTEKLLLYGGAIRAAGSVKSRRAQRHATSDWLEMEQERGISITASVLHFDYQGFRINLLDTPGLLEGDAVSARGVASVKLAMKDREVHAIVYMDRLDEWRVTNGDRAAFRALADAFGAEMWERTVIGLSHGQLSPPNGMPYDDFVAKRAAALRAAIRDELRSPGLALPQCVVENGSRCATNGGGEKVLPDADRTVWLTKFVSTLVDVAKSHEKPMAYDPEKVYSSAADPNKKRRWLVPILLALQTAVLRPLVVGTIRRDVKGGKAGRV